MASESRTTIHHGEIRQWVEEHDGKPVSVRGTEWDDEPGVLRIDSPAVRGRTGSNTSSGRSGSASSRRAILRTSTSSARPTVPTARSSS
jgi:rubrerythrin